MVTYADDIWWFYAPSMQRPLYSASELHMYCYNDGVMTDNNSGKLHFHKVMRLYTVCIFEIKYNTITQHFGSLEA